MHKISSGINSLDRLIDSFYTGDNVVWEVGAGTAYEIFIQNFIKQSLDDGQRIIYISFNSSPQSILKKIEHSCKNNINDAFISCFTLIDCFTSGKGKNDSTFLKFYENIKNINVIRIENPKDIDEFTTTLNSIEDNLSTGVRYVFDSLTGMQDLWGDENITYKFFTYMCPRLYDLDTVAYWILEKDAHSQKFKANLRHITQVVFDLYERRDRLYIKALKLAGRQSREPFNPHLYEINNDNVLITYSRKEATAGIGSRLKELRASLGMNQKDLADRVNLTPSFISQVENNQISPSLNSFLQICHALGVNPGQLMEDKRIDGWLFKKETVFSNPVFSSNSVKIYNIVSSEKLSARVIAVHPMTVLDRQFLFLKYPVFMHVIKGKISVKINGSDNDLQTRDSIFFKESLPIDLKNNVNEEVELLVVSA